MDPILIGAFAAAGALCIAAFVYHRGYQAGMLRGRHTEDLWRDTAIAMLNSRRDTDLHAATLQRRYDAMGGMLKNLGYTILEIEDPATGRITYQATMTQPASPLPLGPSMS